jgi:hypothetical protein
MHDVGVWCWLVGCNTPWTIMLSVGVQGVLGLGPRVRACTYGMRKIYMFVVVAADQLVYSK